MVVVLMGVSGSGKTAVGRGLAARLGWPFVDADDLHSAGNVRKMTAGMPLTDADRLPWLESVRDTVAEHAESNRSVVIACSALTRAYRDVIRAGDAEVRFVHLRAAPSMLERRLRERRGHFFHPDLLASQLDTLEEPTDALVANADDSVDAVVDTVVRGLGLANG